MARAKSAKGSLDNLVNAALKAHAEKPGDDEHLTNTINEDSVPPSKNEVAKMYWATIPVDESMKTRTGVSVWREHKEAFQDLLKAKGQTINDNTDEQTFLSVGKELGRLKAKGTRTRTPKGETTTTTKKPATSSSKLNLKAFVNRVMQGENIDPDTLAMAIAIIADLGDVQDVQRLADKWSKLVESQGGDTTKAQEVVELVG